MTVTHEVVNQAPPLTGFSTADEPALLEALRRDGAGWGEREVSELGALAGSAAVQDQARWAEEQPPRLRTHDRFGHRVDEVEFHPAWHQLMTVAVEHGLHAAPWADDRPGAHLVRAAKFYVWSQAEAGPRLPDLDDLRRRPRPAGRTGARRALRAAAGLPHATTSGCGRR